MYLSNAGISFLATLYSTAISKTSLAIIKSCFGTEIPAVGKYDNFVNSIYKLNLRL